MFCLVGSVIVISAVLPCKQRVAAARFCDPDARSWNTRRICALVILCKPSVPPGNMRVKSVVIERSNLTMHSVRTPETALGDTCPLDERRSTSSACLIMAGSTRAACSTVACPTCPIYASNRAPAVKQNVLTVKNGSECPSPPRGHLPVFYAHAVLASKFMQRTRLEVYGVNATGR
jgi:hypothetical protein